MDETDDHTKVSGDFPLAGGWSTVLPCDEDCRLDSFEAAGEFSEQSSGDSTMSDRNTCGDSSSSEMEDDSLDSFHHGHLCDWEKNLPASAEQVVPPKPKPEAIRQHDVFLSCHYNYQTLANHVYDRVVCPERTLTLDLKIVKKEIRDALLNTIEFVHAYGDGVDVPEPKFWIPAKLVEKEGQLWKGRPGTRRTVLVAKCKNQIDVYEASDMCVIKENHGNSNRGKNRMKWNQSEV